MTLAIRSIEAFAIRSDLVGGPPVTAPRRPAWTADAEVANPMSHYPRFKRLRASWRPTWPSVACLVKATDGRWGLGMTRYGAPVISIINEHLGPLLVGEPCLAVERLWDMMVRMSSPYAGGLSQYAISAIDLALWDLKGKVLGQPVYGLLGGPVRDDIRCYATGNDTDWHMECGFTGTKLACPYGPADGAQALERNEALVAERRALVGPQVDLMLDCWMAFDLEFAVRMARRLAPYQLRWIEDCLAPDDMDGQTALRARLPGVTLASGEHWYTLAPFAQAAARHNTDIFQPDIGWSGGLTGCLKIAHIAEGAGIAVVPHAGVNTPYGQHFGMAVPNAPMGEYFVASAPGVPLQEVRLTPGMQVPKDGRVRPDDSPGFGLGLTLDGVRAMAV
ncbi:MAG: enolase C-terminal domain-like protein [Rhodoferax sp.]